jgi:hypothetical protein
LKPGSLILGNSGKRDKPIKEIDLARTKFRKMLIEKYSIFLIYLSLIIDALATELGLKRWMKKSLPNYFFTKHLTQLGWAIEGADDLKKIKDVKEIPLARLREIMEGMENGSVTIIDRSLLLE